MRIITCAGVILVYLLAPAAYSQGKSRDADPFYEFVKRLPSADRVEVITLTPLLTEEVKNADCTRPGLVCAPDSFPYEVGAVTTLIGDEAKWISALWRALERDRAQNGDRCLTPDHMLRFFQGEKLLLESQVCALCRQITLPKIGVTSVAGSIKTPYYRFQDYLMRDSNFEQRRESFKHKMFAKVGQSLTVIGLLGGGKPDIAVEYGKGEIYLRGTDMSLENKLINLGCHIVVKVSGILRFYPEPLPQKAAKPEQLSPEHFYFDSPKISVIRVEKPRRPRRRHKANRNHAQQSRPDDSRLRATETTGYALRHGGSTMQLQRAAETKQPI